MTRYPSEKALSIRPMVDGVQFKSLAQAAAATLKLLRSAHSRTLPAKNTITVTGQLIGRTWPRGTPVAAVSVLGGIVFFSRPSGSVAFKSGAAICCFPDDSLTRLPSPVK